MSLTNYFLQFKFRSKSSLMSSTILDYFSPSFLPSFPHAIFLSSIFFSYLILSFLPFIPSFSLYLSYPQFLTALHNSPTSFLFEAFCFIFTIHFYNFSVLFYFVFTLLFPFNNSTAIFCFSLIRMLHFPILLSDSISSIYFLFF